MSHNLSFMFFQWFDEGKDNWCLNFHKKKLCQSMFSFFLLEDFVFLLSLSKYFYFELFYWEI